MAIGDGVLGVEEISGGQIHKLEGLNALQDHFQLVGFISAAQKAGKTHLIKKGKTGAASFGLDDLLVYSNEDIPASLLKLSPDNVARSVQMFTSIRVYLGDSPGEKLTDAQRIDSIQKLLHQGLKRPELKDELYMQLLKQTRGNTVPESRFRAWEMFNLLAATMPPSKDLMPTVSAYVSARAIDDSELSHIQKVAVKTWNSLKRTSRAGPRRMLPSAEEITAVLKDTKLNTILFFVDDTFDNLDYDPTTTVQEASGVLAASIRLEHYKSFTLFECRRHTPASKGAAPAETEDEFGMLGDNRYVADILVELKAKNDKSGKDVTHKLVFKKRMFRKDDAKVDDLQFNHLTYIQCQQDCIQGHYPVVKEDAAQLCALQMQAEHGADLLDDDQGIMASIEKYITKQILMTRPKDEWKRDISQRYKALDKLTKEEAKMKFLQILRALPYGMSMFYPVKRVEDPVGLLPAKVVIGVNTRGVHFFRPNPKEYLHSAELKDILQFGSGATSLFLKVKVAGADHIFQFETRQGGEICSSLQTHINDAMLKSFIKAKAARGEIEEETRKESKSFANPKYQQHLMQLQQALEESQNEVDAMQKATDELRYAKEKALAEIEDVDAALKREEEQCSALQAQSKQLEVVLEANKQEIEVTKAKSTAAAAAAAAAGAELAAIDMARFEQLEELLKERSEQLSILNDKHKETEKRVTALTKEKTMVEAKLKRIEKSMEQENKELRSKLEGVTGNVKQQLQEKDAKLNELAEELGQVQNQLNSARDEIKKFTSDTKIMEMAEIQEMQAEIERKAKQNAHILEEQAKRIAEVQKMYNGENARRKMLFNALEDIRGKIRVFCRVRPLLQSEGGDMAVAVPSDQSLRFLAAKRDFNVDLVFAPEVTQEEVFADCKHVVNSALDGLNVNVWAYGVTGAGKTHTLYGNQEDLGIVPRAVTEMFALIAKDKKGSYTVRAYMLELYQETLTDLLVPAAKRGKQCKIDIKKDMRGMVVAPGATTVEIRDAAHLLKVMEYGHKSRPVIAAGGNKDPSRSTLITTILVNSVKGEVMLTGKLSFFDLEGSERGKNNDPVHKGIGALQNVVQALYDDQQNVPYRETKLTMLMSDAFGGNAKSVMLLHMAPTAESTEESIAALDFAARCNKVKNVVKKQEDTKDTQKLKQQVEYWKGQSSVPESDVIRMWTGLEDIENQRLVDDSGP